MGTIFSRVRSVGDIRGVPDTIPAWGFGGCFSKRSTWRIRIHQVTEKGGDACAKYGMWVPCCRPWRDLGWYKGWCYYQAACTISRRSDLNKNTAITSRAFKNPRLASLPERNIQRRLAFWVLWQLLLSLS